ncbi:MAG TPA: cation:dicarboxylase symporter family transporter [Rhodothermia bacterium]
MSFRNPFKPVHLMIASIGGLVLGIGLGLLGRDGPDAFDNITGALGPLVSIWLRALTIAAIALVVTYIVTAITRMRRKKEAGRMVGVAIVAHLALMLIAGLLSFASAGLFAFFPEPNIDMALSSTDVPRPPSVDGSTGISGILLSVFVDPVTAVVTGNVMALILWSVVIGWLLSVLAPRIHDPIVAVFEWATRVVQKGVMWLLIFMPVAVFHVALALTPDAGASLAGSLGAFLIVLTGIQIAMTAVLYPMASVFGRVPLRRFAEAAIPSQILAIGCRSSLACLPTVVEGARTLLLPAVVSEIIAPFSSGTMRLSQLASHPFTVCFIAFLYGIHLEPGALALLLLGLLLLNYGTPGIPSAGIMTSLPLYLALGIPIEGYVLVKAIDVVPDCFKTVLNVTEHLAITTVAARFHTAEPGDAMTMTEAALQPSVVQSAGNP